MQAISHDQTAEEIFVVVGHSGCRGPTPILQYQLPKYPALARQTRIEGEVDLVVVLEPQTGLTREVKVTSGHPLLTDAAGAAVRDWHFQEGNPRKDPIEIHLALS
jgi:TonB family protein